MTMATSPQRLLLTSALLVACTAPLGSGFMIAREDGAVNGTTMSREELRAAVRGEHARVSAEMRKAGLAPRRWGLEGWPFDEKPWNWLTGTYVNCLQTLSIATDPVWSMIEGIGAVNASCSNGQFDSMPCKEASLGMTETSLGALGWFLDFPTDCLGYTCAFKSPTEPMHPNARTLVIVSAFNDFAAASAGVASAIYGMKLQCVGGAEGDNLGADASFWTHPSLVSLVPAVKEARELIQALSADDTTKWQKRDVYLSLLEWIAGTVQSFKEAEMDEYKEMKPPEDKKSATEACTAAAAHTAAATIGLFGSIAKGVACYLGELKLPQSSAVRNFAGGGAYSPPTSAPTQPTSAAVGGPEPSVSSHHSIIPPEPSESVGPVDPVVPYDITETSHHSIGHDVIPPPPGLDFPAPPGLPAPVPVDESDIVPVVDVSDTTPTVVTPVVRTTPCRYKSGVDYDICYGLAKRNDGEMCFDQCCRSTNYNRWQSIQKMPWCRGVTIPRHTNPNDMHKNDANMARGARSLKRLQSLEELQDKQLLRRQTQTKLELD